MKIWNGEVDFDRTIKDFEFTRRASRNINRIVESADFEHMETEVIYQYLDQNTELVVFKDFLKRYIHKSAQIPDKMSDVPDEVYREILTSSFKEKYVPFSMTPTSKRPSAIVKSWLQQDCVKRSTVFLIGFGLGMSVDDVSMFLEKVIKEDDFRFWDSDEIIYWYCFKNRLSYRNALIINKKCQEYIASQNGKSITRSFCFDSEPDIKNENELLEYVYYLKQNHISEGREAISFQAFCNLYDECRRIIRNIYQSDAYDDSSVKNKTVEDITSADLEKFLCSGIPLTKSGNLTKMSASLLAKQFENKRISRQRLDSLLNKKLKIERFDLLTLLFFIFAEEVEPDWPTERYLQFIDKSNELLDDCGMMGIYPVNPYEAFILMCLLTEAPLDTYSSIWEKSYES